MANGKGFTAAIGGPHRSFANLVNHVGDSVRLMSYFAGGLKEYHNLGAPKLPTPLMSIEDIQFAQTMNYSEVAKITGDLSGLEVDNVETEREIKISTLDVENYDFPFQCQGCGHDIAEPLSEILAYIGELIGEEKLSILVNAAKESEPDEKLHDLKTLIKVQEEGISLDYRCPKCRACNDCRNASTTERISLREEIEDQAIKESVTINYEAKKISAKMPLRGDENKFLSNNRKIALKVLQSQCVKLKNDQIAKDTVVKAFHKLLNSGYAVKLDDLSDEQKQKMLSKPLQHWLPWRVVHKDSVSTPCRPVFDGSTKCPVLEDGTGGHCLNNLTMKGRISTLDLLTMLLRFGVGSHACAGDLKQFYCSIDLDESQYNLQRVLWKEGMDLDSEVVELVIVTLIYGIRCVSALSEKAILEVADHISQNFPRLADLLVNGRYVDDLADSDTTEVVIKNLIDTANDVFDSVGLRCKGWTVSGAPPHPDCTHDGLGIDVGGMTWWPQTDSVMIKIPPLHFGKKSRGKLTIGTEVFDGTYADLIKFVPEKVTRRQVVSKFASVYDPLGKLLPVTAAMKVHLRKAVAETKDWDDYISIESRKLWIQNFWRLQKLKGLQFSRARIPIDAVNCHMELVAAADAAEELKVCGVWARFLRSNGEYSSQLIIGRGLLSKEGSSIPKEELEACAIGSNLLWIVRKSLSNWVKEYLLVSDSVISLCWITAENKRLSLFHRNRCNQVRFHTDASKLFHVRTDYNPADIPTRTEKVSEDSVGPNSLWEQGMDWMKGSIRAAVQADILKPAEDLRLVDKEETEFDRGLILERTPEILVQGHVASRDRVTRLSERAKFSNYIFSPSKFDFQKVTRITALVFKFIRKCKYSRLKNVEKTFKSYPATYSSVSWGSAAVGIHGDTVGSVPVIEDIDIARALHYWYSKATDEVEKFVKRETIARVGIKKNGILYCRSRILAGQRLTEAGNMGMNSLGMEIGLNLMTPLVDRWSPIAYSIALFIHVKVGRHAGYETCSRLSLEYCHILQSPSLFKQISDECSGCMKIRRKYLEVAMSPVSDCQLTISPPFHTAFCDLDGPYIVYVPGFERQTRNRKVLTCKTWIMTFVCPMTKLCNLQVIESKNSEAVLEGLIRLGCEVGMPSCLILDQETSFMKMVRDAEVSLQDLNYRCYKEYGIKFKVAPVSGHNFIGLAERKIRAVQEAFQKLELKNIRLHATGLQTFCKLVENHLNCLPLGYSYGRDANNTPLLKIITPNMMRMGRLNSRSLWGPMKFASGPKDYLKKVQDTYEAFYRIWNITMVPKLIAQPKWFADSPEIKANDVVMFRKVDNDLSSDWTVGQIDSVVRSKDGSVRRVNVRYSNAGDTASHITDRAVRSIVRLFSLEDTYFIDDMNEVEKLITSVRDNTSEKSVQPIRVALQDSGFYAVVNNAEVDQVGDVRICQCCCKGHCSYLHVFSSAQSLPYFTKTGDVSPRYPEVLYPGVDLELMDDDRVNDDLVPCVPDDEFFKLLTCLETDLNLD